MFENGRQEIVEETVWYVEYLVISKLGKLLFGKKLQYFVSFISFKYENKEKIIKFSCESFSKIQLVDFILYNY